MIDQQMLMHYAVHAVGPTYIILTAAALLSIVSPALNSLSSHGKTRHSPHNCQDKSAHRGLYQRIWNFLLHNKYLLVNKDRFIDFYATGAIITTITSAYNSDKFISDSTYWLPMLLLQIHLLRRFYECLYVQKTVSTSTMHIAGYLLGMVHYLWLPFVYFPMRQESEQENCNRMKILIVVIGCFYFQYQQHRHHVILGNLRPKESSGGVNSYRIPRGDWFEYVSCPHYLAEIMIYFMMAILIQMIIDERMIGDEETDILHKIYEYKHWVVLFWVCTNLSISSKRTHSWYITTFGHAYPRRKRLIPFIW